MARAALPPDRYLRWGIGPRVFRLPAGHSAKFSMPCSGTCKLFLWRADSCKWPSPALGIREALD
eukprot:3906165-Heterocapsa_arctica.AAC.1